MKTIITEYLGIVIAVIAGIGIISLILFMNGEKSGLAGIAGAFMEKQTENVLKKVSYEKYDSFLEKGPLQITYIEENPIYTETVISISEHFAVNDEEGNAISYKIADICDNAGNSCYEQVLSESDKIQFSYPGVYQILIETQEANSKKVLALIAFPVKQREGSRL